MSIAISKFFSVKLKSPLNNINWSWGSFNEERNHVCLRVWAGERRKLTINGKSVAGYYVGGKSLYGAEYDTPDHMHGFNERNEHLDMIRAGSKAILVIIHADDYDAEKWTIKSYNDKTLFLGDELVTNDDGQIFCIANERVTVKDYAK